MKNYITDYLHLIMKKRLHLTISGRVQGVFYRDTTKKLAQELKLTGWVKNLANGYVEVVAEGEKEQLNKLLEFCKDGPKEAFVNDIKIEWHEFKKEFKEFEVL